MKNNFLILKIIIVMIAFSANSLLCRVALKDAHIDSLTFSMIRIVSGAVALLPLLLRRHHHIQFKKIHVISGISLTVYIVAFSLAYEQIDAGIGALILFGVVQLTMIIYGLCKGETLSRIKLTGLLFAFGGLVYLLVPSSVSTIHLPPLNVIFMALSGFAWAVYSLAGNSKGSTPVNTAYNFLLAVPAGAVILLIVSLLMPGDYHADMRGIILAVLSGAVASAGSYYLWYSVLPYIESITASTVQLSVPCLSILLAVVFIGEILTAQIIIATTLVLTGIFIVIKDRKKKVRTKTER